MRKLCQNSYTYCSKPLGNSWIWTGKLDGIEWVPRKRGRILKGFQNHSRICALGTCIGATSINWRCTMTISAASNVSKESFEQLHPPSGRQQDRQLVEPLHRYCYISLYLHAVSTLAQRPSSFQQTLALPRDSPLSFSSRMAAILIAITNISASATSFVCGGQMVAPHE